MPFDHRRLRESMEFANRDLEPFRRNRREFVTQYVGAHYSDYGAPNAVPLNMVEMTVNTYTRLLAARDPRVLCTTHIQDLKAWSKIFNLAINDSIKKIMLGKTIAACVQDSLFSMGIAKMGLNPSLDYARGGFYHGLGMPYVEPVSLDDFVFDTTARRWEDCQFIGNKYRMLIDDAINSGLVDPEQAHRIKPVDSTGINEDGSEKTSTVGGRLTMERRQFLPQTELWDVWIPPLGLMVTMNTLREADNSDEPLAVRMWTGPRFGPYHVLGMADVPDSIMPLSPTMVNYDLHLLGNELMRKLARQAQRQKDILLALGGNADADAVRMANDGEVVGVNTGQPVNEVSLGGINQKNFGMMLQTVDLNNRYGGNPEMLGGLGAQSRTLGQDQLISENASNRVAEMQSRTIEFTRRIVSDLAFYLWSDPYIELPLTYRLDQSPEIEQQVTFSGDKKMGAFYDYNINVEPYSMQHKSPQQHLQFLMSVVQGIALPMMPMLAQQGVQLNLGRLFEIMGELADEPKLREIIQTGSPSEQAFTPEVQRSPISHRTYERRDSGPTGGNDQAALISRLMGDSEGALEAAV